MDNSPSWSIPPKVVSKFNLRRVQIVMIAILYILNVYSRLFIGLKWSITIFIMLILKFTRDVWNSHWLQPNYYDSAYIINQTLIRWKLWSFYLRIRVWLYIKTIVIWLKFKVAFILIALNMKWHLVWLDHSCRVNKRYFAFIIAVLRQLSVLIELERQA